jgi:hypothetical protein
LELTFDSRVKHLSRQHTVTAWSLWILEIF